MSRLKQNNPQPSHYTERFDSVIQLYKLPFKLLIRDMLKSKKLILLVRIVRNDRKQCKDAVLNVLYKPSETIK